MNKKEAIKIYYDTLKKINAYNLIFNTTFFDRLTIAPKKGSKYRNEVLAYMDGEIYAIKTEKNYLEAINYLASLKLDDPLKREIQLAKKAIDKITSFTQEEEIEFSLLQMNANDAWEEAKSKNNYALFEKYLKKLFDIAIIRAKKRNPNINPYDIYLDDYEEAMTIKNYDKFFSLIKKELTPLIKKISKKQDLIDDSFLYKYYPKDKQELFLKELRKYLGFDPSWSYLGEYEHPFTHSISKNDIRITTSYDEYNITSAIFSTIHEIGHALYEHQLDDKYFGTQINIYTSGMHESQSRFLENYISRRESFWVTLYPKLQKLFPENLEDITLKDFIKAINISKPSLIRTEADELTYPMHIMIRYEIEKGIFNNKINTNKLNKTWNKMYEKYLGIKVKKDSEGILQDVHWSDASFGYFPTYALGSAFSAQFFRQLEKDIDVDKELENNNFKAISKWLKNNIHQYGALYDYNTIIKMVTKENFNPKYYINYLIKKYKKLYNL